MVSQATYEAERATRAEAETSLRAAESRNLQLSSDLQRAREQFDRLFELTAQRQADWDTERREHAAQIKTLIDHIAPKPRSPSNFEADGPALKMTAEEIRAMPAVGKRDEFLRERRAREAEERDRSEDEKQAIAQRNASLTDAERQQMNEGDLAFGSMMGAIVEKQPSEEQPV